MKALVADRAGGGLQTFKFMTASGPIERQLSLASGERKDVADVAALPSSPLAARVDVGAVGVVAGECANISILVQRGADSYASVIESDVIEEDTPFRKRRRLKGIFKSGATTWVGGDGNLGGGSTWTVDNRTRRPIKWTLWIETRAGIPGVVFEHELSNDGGVAVGGHAWPANDTFFDRLAVCFDRPSPAPQNVTLLQDHTTASATDEALNFRQTLNGVTTTARHSGEVQIGGGFLGVQYFWQKYPKGIKLAGTRVEVELFPNVQHQFSTTGPFGSGKHVFFGIWTATHRFAVGPTVEDVRRLLRPPAVFPDRAEFRALWTGPIADLKTDADALLNEALNRHSAFHRTLHDPSASSDGATIPVCRERRGYWPSPRQCVGEWYGEQRFGCIFKAGNPGGLAMNIYDWPYIAWLQAIRYRSVEMWDLAEEMTQHTADYDRHKVRRDNGMLKSRKNQAGDSNCQGQHGVWNWEDNNMNSSTRFQHFGPGSFTMGALGTHSWNGGDALGHMLTCKPQWKTNAVEAAEGWFLVYSDHYIPAVPNRWNTEGVATRAQSWTALQFLNAYRVTKDPVWIDRALLCVRTLIYLESKPYLNPGRTLASPNNDHNKYSSGTGDIGGGAIVETGVNSSVYDRGLTVVTFLVYPIEPIIEIVEVARATGRAITDVEDYLLRCLNYLRTKAFKGGTISQDGLSRIPWQTSYRTDPLDQVSTTHSYMDGTNPVSIANHKNNGGVMQYNHFTASLAAFCAQTILKPRGQIAEANAYIAWAREIYRDQFLLIPLTVTPTGFVAWTTRGTVNQGQTWPATNQAKVIGWYGRGGQIALEQMFASDAPPPPPPPPPPPGEITSVELLVPAQVEGGADKSVILTARIVGAPIDVTFGIETGPNIVSPITMVPVMTTETRPGEFDFTWSLNPLWTPVGDYQLFVDARAGAGTVRGVANVSVVAPPPPVETHRPTSSAQITLVLTPVIQGGLLVAKIQAAITLGEPVTGPKKYTGRRVLVQFSTDEGVNWNNVEDQILPVAVEQASYEIPGNSAGQYRVGVGLVGGEGVEPEPLVFSNILDVASVQTTVGVVITVTAP